MGPRARRAGGRPRQSADGLRGDAALVGDTRHFHTQHSGRLSISPSFMTFALKVKGFAGLERMHDSGSVLVAPRRGRCNAVLQGAAQLLSLRDLRLAAAWILVQRDLELLDELGPGLLDEPWDIFGEVLG
jgi:hypothetical protein